MYWWENQSQVYEKLKKERLNTCMLVRLSPKQKDKASSIWFTSTFGGNSNTWFQHFWPNVGNFPKFFQLFQIPPETVAIPTFRGKCRNTDTYRQVSVFRHLQNSVTIVTDLWGMSLLRRYIDKVSLLWRLEEGVAIATFRRIRHYCDGWWQSVALATVGGNVSLLRRLVAECHSCDDWWQRCSVG